MIIKAIVQLGNDFSALMEIYPMTFSIDKTPLEFFPVMEKAI